VRIAPHHIEGTPEHQLSAMIRPAPTYTPVCSWPDDCMVQWGHGLIPAVPFFEAFPPGTFIRGEGETIEQAERKAFAQYESEFLCAHVWSRHHERRGTYLNGAGWCRKCGAFRGRMFSEVVVLGHMRKPLNKSERWLLSSIEEDAEMNDHMDRKYPEQRANRRRTARVLRLRLNLFGETGSYL
jgi:hypothetical protein